MSGLYVTHMETDGSWKIAEYEIPKGSGKTSMFSFSLWIGGIDLNNNLKLCCLSLWARPTDCSTAYKK